VTPEQTALKVGETYTFSAVVSPSNAADKRVSWSSSNTSVATVNSNGVATAQRAGSAQIIAQTVNGITASATLTVSEAKTVVRYECVISVSGGGGNSFNKTYTSQTPYSTTNLPDFTRDFMATASGWPPGNYTIRVEIYKVFNDESRELVEPPTVVTVPIDPPAPALSITSVDPGSGYQVGDTAVITVRATGNPTSAWIRTETGEDFAQTTRYDQSGNTRTFSVRWDLGRAGNRSVSVWIQDDSGRTASQNFSITVSEPAESVIYQATVASSSVRSGDWAYMTVACSSDVTDVWVTDAGGGGISYDIVGNYAAGSQNAFDIRFIPNNTQGQFNGYVHCSGNSTVRKAISIQVES
jgi:hypothetical protein